MTDWNDEGTVADTVHYRLLCSVAGDLREQLAVKR